MAATAPRARRTRVARMIGPLKRLFGPQTSSGARERRDILVLLLAVAFVVVPHFEHVPWWATLLVLLMLLWRGVLTARQLTVPGRALLVPLLFGAAAGVYLEHGTLVGHQAGVTFLLLLMALKLLEMRARRDVFVVIFLCFFILLTQFMYSQGPAVALTTLMAVAALFFVLVSVNLDEADLPAARKLKMVGMVDGEGRAADDRAVPAVPAHLRAAVGHAGRRRTRRHRSVQLDVAGLDRQPDRVARNRLPCEVRRRCARLDQLYWRGPVFGSFNGRTWSPLSRRTVEPAPLTIEADRNSMVEYTSRSNRIGATGCSRSRHRPACRRSTDLNTRLTSEMELLAGDLVRERMRYSMRSYLGFRIGRNADRARAAGLADAAATYNPRTHEFAVQLQKRVTASAADRDLRLVRAAIDHLGHDGYAYTLSPPRLGRHSVDEFLFDTKRGYCEHYSSAFVVLMRSLGIPARVVTGYQGGELNPIDGFVTVRQSDAHAWAEVWLQGRGWSRVDPTAVVAPVRGRRGDGGRAHGRIRPDRDLRNRDWVRVWRFNREAVQNSWNQWVLSYSQERQRALVEMLGLAPRWESVATVLAVIVGVLVAGMARCRCARARCAIRWATRTGCCATTLERAGVRAAEHCGPRDLYERSRRALAATRMRGRRASCSPATKACDIRAAPRPSRSPTSGPCDARSAPSNQSRIRNEFHAHDAACAPGRAARRTGRARRRAQCRAPVVHLPHDVQRFIDEVVAQHGFERARVEALAGRGPLLGNRRAADAAADTVRATQLVRLSVALPRRQARAGRRGLLAHQ